MEQFQKALELDPNFAVAYALLALIYALKGMNAESLGACEKAASLFWDDFSGKALRSLILAIVGKTDEAKAILNDFKKQPKPNSMALITLASSSSVLGEKDEAFEFLEAAYQQRVSLLVFLGVRSEERRVGKEC